MDARLYKVYRVYKFFSPAKELGLISLPVWLLLGSWAERLRCAWAWADLEVTGVMLPWNRGL